MSAPTPLPSQQTLVLDSLFSCLAEQAVGRPQPLNIQGASLDEPGLAVPDAFTETYSPPAIENADDLEAAHEWLSRERQRLNAYTQSQLSRIQSEHQAFVQKTYLKEQGLVYRTQELNRKEEMLQHQFGVLRQRADAVAEQERKLAPYLHPLWDGQAELAELRRIIAGLGQEASEQRALVERLRCEAGSLQKEREAAQAELASAAAALQKEREAFEARQTRMNQRLKTLDEAEAATHRRARELDETEARLRREFQEQEEQLAQLRRVSAGLAQDTKGQRVLLDRLRTAGETLARSREAAQAIQQKEKDALAARQAQLKQRLLALETAEVAVRRRTAELDELEARLSRDFDERERQLSVMLQDARTTDAYCGNP